MRGQPPVLAPAVDGVLGHAQVLATCSTETHGSVVMASVLANWKRLKWIKPDESLSVETSWPKLGFGAEQRVNHFIVINPGAPR